jgi:hypothetical protein
VGVGVGVWVEEGGRGVRIRFLDRGLVGWWDNGVVLNWLFGNEGWAGD